MSERIDPLRALIFEAADYGMTITVGPYRDDGWQIGYMAGMGGGDLVTAPLFEDAVAAAVEPLRATAERLGRREP